MHIFLDNASCSKINLQSDKSYCQSLFPRELWTSNRVLEVQTFDEEGQRLWQRRTAREIMLY